MAEAKVLVLGGCGFVGRNLVAYLIENNLASMTIELFSVYLQPSAKLSISGDCELEVSTEEIILFDVKCSNVRLVSWPIPSLRRFGFDATRRCDTGEGMFVFKTKDGERIHQLVQSYAHQLAFDSSKCLSADDSDNDNCIFHPLPPVPSE
eukprot:gene1165-15519_t